jgi:hypothetical protein
MYLTCDAVPADLLSACKVIDLANIIVEAAVSAQCLIDSS